MMSLVSRINAYLLWKLPAAILCGVRVKSVSETNCITSVTHRWINQNPFRSMYFAVQAMAAELSTGVLITLAVKACPQKIISTLVTSVHADFHKKATGRILFTCVQREMIENAISNLQDEPIEISLKATGTNESGEVVSVFTITWSLKRRQS